MQPTGHAEQPKQLHRLVSRRARGPRTGSDVDAQLLETTPLGQRCAAKTRGALRCGATEYYLALLNMVSNIPLRGFGASEQYS
eukprot:3644246-Alexandrium_andersonii.AAC.1